MTDRDLAWFEPDEASQTPSAPPERTRRGRLVVAAVLLTSAPLALAGIVGVLLTMI